jgi:hypothetical protein
MSSQDDLVKELIELVRETQTSQTKLIESMMAAHAAQANVFQSWLEMFKPTSTPIVSTSVEDREQLRQEREMEEWEPMAMSMAQSLLKNLEDQNG